MNLTMVTGGSRSGKSEFAENMFNTEQPVCYVATSRTDFFDQEMEQRIKIHQKRRPDTWETKEEYKNLGQLIVDTPCSYFLIDDATNLTTNLFFDILARINKSNDLDDVFAESLSHTEVEQITKKIMIEWNRIFELTQNIDKKVVIVTNEVGLGIVPATKLTRILRDIYGSVNQLIAQKSETVWIVVSGLPLKIKEG
ncbi:bifunctional adenosylcobinamide kinase/adenosylcobinamide-phosphate guanylyltransferase [Pediococcus claussenii]|uniref:Adenosylcobinamide kinase n=1 Tax=Pediococcus claussenii (strain ATCC BAA-344 / DSM 14800 / JCM 18046 / KCTC 3811 / LMG 21948 / P06) TaxID=701521 RepID=G8PEM6_PEDCP|nr:bifunctional adenosylcobinamide kinase/adenosylcobinamide-phosphate guanylyltransferase [Pediococcus claussenii]AEV95635.1 bifunctional protein CobU, adenosylcobinamide kinase/adenosylcobinamide-phosphate guanylyltransferase [Pediococcus claussenii ATCC BAA-344]ANZ69155.1 adenosylcobinamide kinase [Pediococcus claussenii]ANZ70972.1 adenosylcobinamide kinase [Pediococcus claussenii]KRN20132.1 cobU protein [Pediococcus claussenii]